MACNIEISEEYRDKYGLPKEMPEAEFYAWLANGGLENVAVDAGIKFSFSKIDDTKFKESLGIAKRVSDSVKLSIKKLNKLIYGSMESAAKTAAKDTVSTINFLQNEARQYLKDNKIYQFRNNYMK
jgi:hypothetical protein